MVLFRKTLLMSFLCSSNEQGKVPRNLLEKQQEDGVKGKEGEKGTVRGHGWSRANLLLNGTWLWGLLLFVLHCKSRSGPAGVEEWWNELGTSGYLLSSFRFESVVGS